MRLKFSLLLLPFLLLFACGEDDEVTEMNQKQSEEETFVVFRNLDIQTEKNSFVLTGEVNAMENVFYYSIEQGEETLVEEQPFEVDDSEWAAFEITEELPEQVLEGEDPPIINMYGKTTDNEIVNPNYIPIDVGIR